VQKGLTGSDENLMNALPQALSQTKTGVQLF